MSKYYCFYDTKINKILRISPVKKSRDTDTKYTVCFEIDESLANDILIGKKSYKSLIVFKSYDNKYSLLEKEMAIKKVEKAINLIDTLPLVEIIENNVNKKFSSVDIKLIFYKKSKKIKIFISNEIKDLIKEPICFYITGKNDPSNLLRIIYLDKLNDNTFNIDYIRDQYSIFTKRIFNNYYMEFLNE